MKWYSEGVLWLFAHSPDADFNALTLKGLVDTLHVMGGLRCVTPSSNVLSPGRIEKFDVLLSAEEISDMNRVLISRNVFSIGTVNVWLGKMQEVMGWWLERFHDEIVSEFTSATYHSSTCPLQTTIVFPPSTALAREEQRARPKNLWPASLREGDGYCVHSENGRCGCTPGRLPHFHVVFRVHYWN